MVLSFDPTRPKRLVPVQIGVTFADEASKAKLARLRLEHPEAYALILQLIDDSLEG